MATVWDRLIVFLAGKNIAILGPRGAGKTTLYDYLAYGTVRGNRDQTIAPTPRDLIRHKKLRLNLKKGTDVPGAPEHYQEWQRIFTKADIVFYVFDAHLARTDPEHIAQIGQDGKELRAWGCRGKTIHVLGTHTDEDDLRDTLTAARYADEILGLDVVEALRARLGKASIGVGSMATNRAAGALLRQVLDR